MFRPDISDAEARSAFCRQKAFFELASDARFDLLQVVATRPRQSISDFHECRPPKEAFGAVTSKQQI
jgi:hypothetical protein